MLETHVHYHDTELHTLSESVQETRRILIGNGDVGLAERVRVLERIASSFTKFKWWVMAGVGGLIIKLFFDMVVFYIQQTQQAGAS